MSSSSCSGTCFLLSDEELAEMVASGWVHLGGPFDSESECAISCCTSDSCWPDCPNPIPDTLNGFATSGGGGCSCFIGQNFTLNKSGSVWAGGWTGCVPARLDFTLSCDNGVFTLDVRCNSSLVESIVDPSPVCDPLMLTFNSSGPLVCGPCNVPGFTIVLT